MIEFGTMYILYPHLQGRVDFTHFSGAQMQFKYMIDDGNGYESSPDSPSGIFECDS